jgi:uncharacterized protein YceH (UPF0502 family)
MDAVEDLSPPELRVLGCLIEKEATTPDQYPLTLNSLTLACNQSTNREPVVSYDQDTVVEALSGLRERGLARLLYPAHGRATKYRQVMGETWALTAEELAVLAVLMLRGPQTLNELKARTERYGGNFADLGGVEGVLDRLAGRPEPVVVRIERQVGWREDRYAHLLAGQPDLSAVSSGPTSSGSSGSSGLAGSSGTDRTSRTERLDRLEEQVQQLRADLDELRERLGDLLDS